MFCSLIWSNLNIQGWENWIGLDGCWSFEEAKQKQETGEEIGKEASCFFSFWSCYQADSSFVGSWSQQGRHVFYFFCLLGFYFLFWYGSFDILLFIIFCFELLSFYLYWPHLFILAPLVLFHLVSRFISKNRHNMFFLNFNCFLGWFWYMGLQESFLHLFPIKNLLKPRLMRLRLWWNSNLRKCSAWE